MASRTPSASEVYTAVVLQTVLSVAQDLPEIKELTSQLGSGSSLDQTTQGQKLKAVLESRITELQNELSTASEGSQTQHLNQSIQHLKAYEAALTATKDEIDADIAHREEVAPEEVNEAGGNIRAFRVEQPGDRQLPEPWRTLLKVQGFLPLPRPTGCVIM